MIGAPRAMSIMEEVGLGLGYPSLSLARIPLVLQDRGLSLTPNKNKPSPNSIFHTSRDMQKLGLGLAQHEVEVAILKQVR